MSKIRFTAEQVAELRTNENVTKCSDKAISYSKDFKIKAVKQYLDEGMSAKQIFKEAGFDLRIIGRDNPKSCLGDWRRIFKIKGQEGLMAETRGWSGRPRVKELTGTKKIEWLEAKVAYLKAENDFLAKLRAKRVE